MDIEAVTELNVDVTVAALIAAQNSRTRTELAKVLPTGGGGGTVALPAAIVTSSRQNPADGSWPNPIRPAGGGMRWFIGAAGRPVPTAANGLAVGDAHVAPGIFRICTSVTTGGTQSNTWVDVLTGSIVVTDPGTVTPTPDPDPDPGGNQPPAPAMTIRPTSLIQTVGTWASTGGTSIVQALSDQQATGVTATPAVAGGDVRIRVGLPPLLLANGHDLLVTLWGTSGTPAGNISVTITRNGSQLVTPVTRPVTTTTAAVEFRWSSADLPIIAAWDNLVLDVYRPAGGLEILDISAQSVPPVVTPPGGGGQPVTRFGGVFGSDATLAPVSIYGDAKRAYIKNAGQIILGCYDDAPLIVTATATTPRVKVTTTVAGGNNSSGTGWADSVPIPAGQAAPSNRWRVMLVDCPETGEYWEFVDAVKSAAGAWTCSRGGKITKTSTSNGVMPTGTGITGSGLALAAPAITLEEAQRAAQGDVTAIGHTLGLNLPTNFYAATYWTTPATRTDGQVFTASEEASRKTVPLTGDRVRLKASFSETGLTGLSRAIAVALKKYGAVIMGGSAKPSIICQSGEGRATEPWGQLMDGKGADNILSWLTAENLEAIPAGWMSSSSTVNETPLSGGPVTPPPAPGPGGGTGSSGTSLSRVQIKLPTGIKWASGASCRGIEDGSEGMGSPFAQWRGEPCYMGRTWWDANSKPEWTLRNRWENWHASIDCGPGWLWTGETLAQAASGALSSRWENELRVARQWWASRRDPSVATVYMSPAHEMNGTWYRWSQTPSNRTQFMDAWKRYREIQLRVFPEALLTYNANAQSMAPVGMDWRRYIPGYDSGGAAGIREWVDCMGVDYYNFGRDTTEAQWENGNGSTRTDQWGAPWGIEAHRRFAEQAGLCLTIPEWGVHRVDAGDTPYYMTAMNNYMRKHAGTGAGKIPAEAYFNLSSGYAGRFAIMGDDVGSPNAAARYRELVWGN